MQLILNIDTATDRASVSLARAGRVLQERVNIQPMDHAAWIHTAIKDMVQCADAAYTMKDVCAVAVVAGPGSYTGIRVGMATAKGLCYALNIPLISLNTLAVMAYAANKENTGSMLIAPMLDARRMEVFTAVYDASLHELLPPCAMVLDEHSFSAWLDKQPVLFLGNGSHKWKELVRHEHAIFRDVSYTPSDIAFITNDAFVQQAYAPLAYTEPIYLKEFYSTQKNTAGGLPA